ncbi:MAG TPA: pyridoxamine 5'-phosphate oxidase family protein [Candidatus Acidoferrum sp.]|nr:pyridoxamine 5'-phosphate oxidase family protein [Candidatus Acidoferrum sp.]
MQHLDRARVNRLADRASYDRAIVDPILDEARVAHVGVVVDGAPVVLPYACARVGDELILHGSVRAGALGAIADGAAVCATVTHLDGLVVAHSAFHSSMNYRAVVIHGRARHVVDRDEKLRLVDALVDRLLPGWRGALRPITDGELEATLVVALALELFSAKIRSGGPKEPDADVRRDVWAGVVPLRLVAGIPEATAAIAPGVRAPSFR